MEKKHANAPTIVPPQIAYTIIGALTGTAFAIPLILTHDPVGKLIGGLVYRAPVGTLIGYRLGRRKKRQQSQQQSR